MEIPGRLATGRGQMMLGRPGRLGHFETLRDTSGLNVKVRQEKENEWINHMPRPYVIIGALLITLTT